MARIYHWYDMRIFKVPGFKIVENWLLKLEERRHPGDDIVVPWGCNQDIRCYLLHEKQRKVLLNLEVTKEQYDNLKGHEE
jgi:hypothetical protein